MRVFLFSIISIMFAFLVCFGFACESAYLYPVKFREEIIAHAEKFDVEAPLVASVINVESGYNQNALSNKGAIGLMQILPSTAEWVCKKLGRDFEENALFDPVENILIGSFYLSYLIDYFDSQNLAICAYNAGMGNVKKWLANEEYSSDGTNLHEIPFKETKQYLEKVQKNMSIYKNKL